MDGYNLADEVFRNIGLNENHEISLDDTLRVISFFGYNEEGDRTSKIGFVCYCARERIKKTFESALVRDDFALFDEMVKNIKKRRI
jgi:hypothetical protein